MPVGIPEASNLGTAYCSDESRRYGNLRGVRWRMGLGILPSSPSASIDDLRRVTADSRRRYATLRRRLLIDPHVSKEEISSNGPVIDNPLSQNPDSMWGRFFQNAELERMLDQDLSRLYPERGNYFQASGCQGMLRRILLLWCLTHSEHGYRQGMHELLAPLLYVLHVDVKRLSEVRKAYENHFADKFDGFSYHEDDFSYKFDFKKFSEDGIGFGNGSADHASLSELDPEIQTVVLLGDAYGAEGELGVVLSEKFMEHDAYSMFDALMSGAGGSVAMAEFFNPSILRNGVSPVIGASRAIYHLLSITDSSLHSHLVELGVEPQYFALRWLRVLFGREFLLEDLLIIWDEIFAHENAKCNKENPINDPESSFEVLESGRGAFICAFAVSMIVNLRSSLLASEIATTSLQKLLNYPEDVKLEKLLEKANSLLSVAINANFSQAHTTSSPDSTSPRTPLNSYWEKKWRDLHKEEEKERKSIAGERSFANRIKGLLRTASDPSPSKRDESKKIRVSSVRRSLLNDLEKQLTLGEEEDKVPDVKLAARTSNASASEVDSSDSMNFITPIHGLIENESDGSSIASNSYVEDNETSNPELPSSFPLPMSDLPDAASSKCVLADDLDSEPETKTRMETPSKFHWFRSFGRKLEEGTCQRTSKSNDANETDASTARNKVGNMDPNSIISLKNLGQSMLENIQVIEGAFQMDNRGQTGLLENIAKHGLVGKGQVTALTALKELRKISNLLSEM